MSRLPKAAEGGLAFEIAKYVSQQQIIMALAAGVCAEH